MSLFSKFYFKPSKGEQIETTLRVGSDDRSAIYGQVLSRDGDPIIDALALLFQAGETEGDSVLLSQCYTDSDGHFVFGNLAGETLYLIKVFKNNIKIRELEIKTENP